MRSARWAAATKASTIASMPAASSACGVGSVGWNGIADGASVAHSLDAARGLCPAGNTAWVIGGAQIYAQALPLANEVVVTEIAQDFEGDAFAPVLGGEWREVATYKGFAYVTTEQSSGLVVVNLNYLPDSIGYHTINPGNMQMVCTSGGSMKMVDSDGNSDFKASANLDCPLCVAITAPANKKCCSSCPMFYFLCLQITK